ncbi:MAG: type II toxin-antitoxin system PemK/MazF family toxin [Planctomycetes bacterium]|nr:type II toxin-antitoxin system PemK/MazF family toxin [Planctomycetota bacterium]
MVKRFEVWVVNLDPTVGSEIKKTRPAVIVSPDELNAHLQNRKLGKLFKTCKNAACPIICLRIKLRIDHHFLPTPRGLKHSSVDKILFFVVPR